MEVKPNAKNPDRPYVVVAGTFYYPKVFRPDPGNPSMNIAPSYSVDFVPDNPEDFVRLSKEFKVDTRPPSGKIEVPYFRAKKGVTDDGHRPTVIDSKGNPIPDSVMIGNGSKGFIKAMIFPYKAGKNAGVSFRLLGIQVNELVEYKASGVFVPTDGGYVVNSAKASDEKVDFPFSELEEDELEAPKPVQEKTTGKTKKTFL